jgi:two-component system chemotaxis response regulator CheY
VYQQVFERAGHEMLIAESSQAALALLEKGESRFAIIDRSTTDIDENQFIARVRAARAGAHTYLLLVMPKAAEQDHAGADDYLSKPLTPSELKSRIAIGERILGLGDNLSRAKDQLENLALMDELTGLFNQTAFLNSRLGSGVSGGLIPFSLIALNITGFDTVQEFHGRETTEGVLRLVAGMIREKSRPYDCIGRSEADRFFVALPGVIGTDAEKFVERFIKGIRSMSISTSEGMSVHVDLGAGIVAASRISAAMEIEDLIDQAVQALLRLSEGGGNRIAITYI